MTLIPHTHTHALYSQLFEDFYSTMLILSQRRTPRRVWCVRRPLFQTKEADSSYFATVTAHVHSVYTYTSLYTYPPLSHTYPLCCVLSVQTTPKQNTRLLVTGDVISRQNGLNFLFSLICSTLRLSSSNFFLNSAIL